LEAFDRPDFHATPEFMFPKSENPPTQHSKVAIYPTVPFPVLGDLGLPELG